MFQAVFDGKKDAWSNPAAIEALTKVQELVKANGFIKGFSSITADSNADQALLYTGKAAMMLHGAWTYGSMKTDGGDFVTGGHLGCMNFPPVDGGKGDPSNTVGNPGQYLSISSKATAEQKEIAKKFFATGVLDDAEVKEWIDTGGVPIVKGADSQLAALARTPTSSSSSTTSSSNAKVFAQSWDQALSPTAAETLLDNIAKLFQLSDHPAAVRRQHERGHRQMTTLAPPAAPAPQAARRARRAERLGRVDGAARRWSIFIAFGVIPLIGVLALSFTTWDGIGAIHPSGLDQLAGRAHRPRPAARAVGDLPDHGPVLAGADAAEHPARRLPGRPPALPRGPRGALLHPAAAQLGGDRDHLQGAARPELRPRRRAAARRSSARTGSASPTLAIGVVIFVVSWQFIPFHSLIYQGARAADPAARCTRPPQIDGAGRVRQFFSITLPQLKYTIITSSTLMVVGSLTFFDLIFVLTAGGPGDATRVLALDMYKTRLPGQPDGPGQRDRRHPRPRRAWPWRCCCAGSAAATPTTASWKGPDMATTLTTGPPDAPTARTGRTRAGRRRRQRPQLARRRGRRGSGWSIVIVPIYWIVITSFKTQANYFATNPLAPPRRPDAGQLPAGHRVRLRRSTSSTASSSRSARSCPRSLVSFMAAYAIVRGGRRPVPAVGQLAVPAWAWRSRCRRRSSRST